MTAARATIVMSVFNQLEVPRRLPAPRSLPLRAHAENQPVIATFDRAWRRATTEFVRMLLRADARSPRRRLTDWVQAKRCRAGAGR